MIARERSANVTEYFVIDGGMITTTCAPRVAPNRLISSSFSRSCCLAG
jgi:hypothetical protein